MSSGGTDLLVVAGEASGDQHAARLIAELGRVVPGLTLFGLGGDELRAQGLEAVAHSAEISVVGLTEVLKVLRRARQIFCALVETAERRRPRLAILVDFPEFNLRLAKKLKSLGIPVVYYISPQVWAWRRGRVRSIARVVDRMLVLFQFEADFYRRHEVDVVHVGHPLVDEVPALAQVWDREADSPGPYRVALLPGSRASEVEALLPVLLAAAARLARDLPVEVRLIRAPTVASFVLDEAIALAGIPVEVVTENRFAAVADSHVALCASGTATLEVGLLGTPQVVVYRLSRWTYLLGRLLVRLHDISLVNLVLGRRVVPELIQSAANPERIAAEAARLVTDRPAREAMRSALAGLRTALGRGGASRRAAEVVAELLAVEAAA
jgi:lipid-A-disaccharide synthase